MAPATANGNGTSSRIVEMPSRGVTRQLSFSGTPRGPDGLTTPDDYVRDLADFQRRMSIFDEMRASDDAVFTAQEARRQEISAANWLLTAADDTPASTEILEFVEDNIYPLIDELLAKLCGALAFGFGVLEPVYAWNDSPFVAAIARGKVKRATKSGTGRRIYLRKLAHIRQTAIATFRLHVSGEQKGELKAIHQHAYDGQSYRELDVPAEKVLIWTYDRQGDDYGGVPPARHCYKGWKFKSQIERLTLMHLDRFGVGTPIVTEGEGGFTSPEREKVALFNASWRSGSENYQILPHGATVEIISDEGKGTMSALEWVRYYNLQVAKTYLTQGTELGSTETGARALGEEFFEQLAGIVQGDAEALASIINNKLIVPLVNWNFGSQEGYPTFAPSQRVRKGIGVASVMTQLKNSGAVHFRPEDEAWLRDVYDMPTVDLTVLQQEAEERELQAQEMAKAAGAAGNGKPAIPFPPKRSEDSRERERAATIRRASLFSASRTEGAPDPAPRGSTYRTREFSEWEMRVVRPDVLARDLNLEAARLTGEVQDVLRAIDEDLERQVREAAAKGALSLSQSVRSIGVPGRLRTKLRRVLFEAATRARDYGANAVRQEIRRQLDPEGIGPERAPDIFAPTEAGYRRLLRRIWHLVAGPEDQSARDLHLQAEVDRAVEEEIDRREQSARSAVLTTLAQAANATVDALAAIVSAAASAALVGLSTGRTEQNVQGVVNVGFGIGRSDQADAINEVAADPDSTGSGGRSGMKNADGKAIELVAKIYSAVMDLATCDECAKWDGGHFPIDYPEDYTGVQAPNPRCAGNYSRCRCLWIYVTDQEAPANAPASKGPR